jgi:hypothetical protein
MPNKALVPNRPEYYVQTGSMFENPHGVPHDEIVAFILENPPEIVAQVVFGKYVELSGLVFTGESIQNMIDRSLPRIMGDSYVDQEALAEAATFYATYGFGYRANRWFTGVDFARQTDYTVITTLDTYFRPAKLVYYRRMNRVPWETIYQEVGKARKAWGAEILVDSTGMGGDVVLDALESRVFCPTHNRNNLTGTLCTDRDGQPLGCYASDYLPLSCAEGFNFSGTTKKQLIEHLRNVMSLGYRPNEEGLVYGGLRVPPIVQLEEEMSFYSWDDSKLVTDCLMSLALACWIGLEDVVESASVGSPWGA